MSQPDQAAVSNRLLRAMSAEDYAGLAPHLVPIELPLGEKLIDINAPVSHLHFMEAGISSITTDGANGKVEVGMVGREGLVGASPVLLGTDRVPHDHFVQMAGEGLRIEAGALVAAMDASTTLRRLLLRYVQTEIVQVRQTAYINAIYSIEARLARWLLMCLDRVDGNELALKHEFLSMMLGVQRSGVTLALQALEGSGRIRGRRMRIVVLDREGLEEVSNGGYGAPEAEYARLIEGT
ncbi:MAG: Crp/Fnr family transcriptional regulator [Methylobacterium frigidaeris]